MNSEDKLKKTRWVWILVALGAVVALVLAITLSGGGATVRETVKVPAGQTSFAVSLSAKETEPYAGIEFALTISDEDALAFASFEPSVEDAFVSPFLTQDDLHYFGFYAGSNAFTDDGEPVGVLNFEGYTGDETLTVEVVRMNVIRLDENNETVTTENTSPAYVFTIVRET